MNAIERIRQSILAAAQGQAVPQGADNGRFSGHPGMSDMAMPETPATLAIQQKELVEGKRHVMAFKEGTSPLGLPEGFKRALIGYDTYHFNPSVYTSEAIAKLVQDDRIGEAMRLGPVTKTEALRRHKAGETLVGVVERTPEGTEVRTALGTTETAPDQLVYFRRTQAPENTVQLESPVQVIFGRLARQPQTDRGASLTR